MGGTSVDIWVCANCRSVNNARAKQCYNCRTPRDLAAVDPSQMEVTGHGQVRAVALPPFRSSRGRAILASALIVAVAVLQVASTVLSSTFIVGVLDGQPTTDQQVRMLANLSLASIVIALLALVAWSAWLSRVVTEMPALGLGYPAATGLTAFVENFIPFFNLFRVPAIVRDVVRRVDPSPGRGEALISAAWFGIFGGYLIPRIGGLLNAFGAASLAEALRKQLVVEAVATGIVFVGALFLVVLIWWIEVRITRRHAERPAPMTALGLAAVASPSSSAAPDAQPAAADPVSVRSAMAATGHTSPDVGAASAATATMPTPTVTRSGPTEPPPAPTGPHLVVTIDADGSLVADLDGESEPVTLDSLRVAGEALYRANGSASIRVTGTDEDVRALARETFRVLSHAGVPTSLEP
jgi:hypothetical protein